MGAFNKRFRETTYAGIRFAPLAGLAGFVISGLLAVMLVFSNGAYIIASFLAIISVLSLFFAIYELSQREDYRIRGIQRKSKDNKTKAQVL